MSSKVLSRRSKALTLAPLALLSGVWSASLFSPSATAGGAEAASALPDGTSVPAEAIESPASVPVPGVIAPAVPEGAADSVVSGASSNGIPTPALSAYQRAAQIIDSADKGCNLPWELVAAIGRVESDHGRYAGNRLSDEGVSTPGIYGIPLDGSNGTQAINDTDGGLLDDDKVWDRAVGPMQFIPTTWQVVKVDADGDGERNPQDIDDAALASAVYLCSGDDDLGTRAGQEAAVYRYNRSDEYVQLVLRIMEAYSSGDFTAVPSGTQAGTTFTPSTSTLSGGRELVRQREMRQRRNGNGGGKGAGNGGGAGTGAGSGSGGSTDGGGTDGGSTDGGTVPVPGGGGSTGGNAGGDSTKTLGNTVGKTVDKVVEKVTKPITGGGGSGSSGGSGGGNGGSGGSGGGGGGGATPGPVEKTLTEAEARAQCLASGISKLDVVGLARCIAGKL